MSKTAIITINDNNNYGNRLQNYALQQVISKKSNYVKTLIVNENENMRIKRLFKIILNYRHQIKKEFRLRNFKKFNKFLLKESREIYNYDNYVVGSDQVWNTTFNSFSEKYNLLEFVDSNSRISYAASFGTDSLDKQYHELFKRELSKFKYISVREDKGKEIINKLGLKKDIEVLIDPTMLLNSFEWESIMKKPKNKVPKKYILNYFLGELSNEKKEAIEKVAKEENCEIINILDVKDKFYTCGPSEFLFLEKNAFLVCTDSFHSSVFSIIFDVPFVIFDRQSENMKNMSSRIDTLLNKLEIKNRKYNGHEITKENIEHDYSFAHEKIEDEKILALNYLKKVLDLGDDSNEQ